MNEKKLKEKVEKYKALTEKALQLIEFNERNNAREQAIALDFLDMAKNYFSDGKHFQKKGDLLTALAAFSYAHAWLDAGVRAKIFKATDNQLFTLA